MIRAVALACAAVLLLAGAADASTELVGPTWQLTKLVGVSGGVSELTATFTSDGKVSGFSGCNRYGGAYIVSGRSISISKLNATTMACGRAKTLLERAYLKAFTSVRQYSISGSKLALKSRAGIDLATFAVQPSPLAGTRWELVSYTSGEQAVVSVIAGTKLTANFDAKGNLSGFAGCNSYSAHVTASPPKISIGPLTRTVMACPDPPDVMTQESAYLSALLTAATYEVQGTKLELRTASGAIAADFERA